MNEHLEVIGPSGAIEFVGLVDARGAASFGSAPSNDVHLNAAGVADYAAVLDYHQRPYTLLALAGDGQVRLNGRALQAQEVATVQSWDGIEIGGFVVVVAQDGVDSGASAVAPTAASVAGNGATQPPEAEPTVQSPAVLAPLAATGVALSASAVPGAPAPFAPPMIGPPIPTELDTLILTTIGERVRTIDVQQEATWEITVTNGSSLVSRFQVRVEGWVDESWVTISPNDFNLNERERKTVTVTILPPRHPSSLAGAHHFAVVVTSETLPGHRSQQAATLVIQPYHEYGVDPMEPAAQTLSYFQAGAPYRLPIRNRGNGRATYRVEGSDLEAACRFEFVDEQGLKHLGLRELQLGPAQEVEIPLVVTPLKRRMIGSGARTYQLTVTTLPLEGALTPFPARAELRKRPLFGRWVLLVAALLVIGILLAIFRPRITSVRYTFVDREGVLQSIPSQADAFAQARGGLLAPVRRLLGREEEESTAPTVEAVVRAGQPITVTWETSNGGILTMNPQGMPEQPLVTVDSPAAVRRGSYSFKPPVTVNEQGDGSVPPYEIRVQNWMSRLPLIKAIGEVLRPVVVGVVPANAPFIHSFGVNTDTTVVGNPITIDWDVTMPNDGDQLVLEQRQGGEIIATAVLAEPQGTLVLTPIANTEFGLVPSSKVWLGQDVVQDRRKAVTVLTPTPTLVPTPAIRAFLVEPSQVVAGTSITVSYAVSGSDITKLRLFGLPSPEVPLDFPTGKVVVPVPAPGPFNVVLEALNLPEGSKDSEDAAGARATAVASRVAQAPTPTATPTPTLSPTPTPQEPIIEVLSLSPEQVVLGDKEEEQVLLTWNVIGDISKVEITAPDFEISSTKKKDTISVPRDKTRVFVFTVLYNGEPKASESVELKVLEPTPIPPTEPPPPPPPPTETPTPTPTRVPPPIVLSYVAASDQPIRKEVDADGTDIYFVDGGTEVTIRWLVEQANEARLTQTTSTETRTYEKRLAADQVVVTALGDLSFLLEAFNNPEGLDVSDPASITKVGKVQRTLKIGLNDVQPVDPPTNVSYAGGIDESTPVTITWQYDPAQAERILGFRVYRAPSGSTDFVRVANEADLDKTARSWTDETAPFCSRAYYLVAVYQDLTLPGEDKTVETDSGSTSFLTPPCPSP